MLVRAGACLLLALAVLPVVAPAAAAHGESAPAPGTELPRVLAVQPAVPGLAVVVVEGGLRMRVDNGTSAPVTVLPDGPVVAPGGFAAWVEPRATTPAWRLVLRAGAVPVTVTGDRVTPAPPDPVPWWSYTLAAALLTVALGRTAVAGSRRATLALAVVTLLTVAAHAVHVVGSALVLAVPPGPGTVLAAAGPGLLVWVLGVVGAGLVANPGVGSGHDLGPAACTAAGALALLLTAFDVTAFHDAVLAFGWAYPLDRATTVLTVGCGTGLLLTGIAQLGARPMGAQAGTPSRH